MDISEFVEQQIFADKWKTKQRQNSGKLKSQSRHRYISNYTSFSHRTIQSNNPHLIRSQTPQTGTAQSTRTEREIQVLGRRKRATHAPRPRDLFSACAPIRGSTGCFWRRVFCCRCDRIRRIPPTSRIWSSSTRSWYLVFVSCGQGKISPWWRCLKKWPRQFWRERVRGVESSASGGKDKRKPSLVHDS